MTTRFCSLKTILEFMQGSGFYAAMPYPSGCLFVKGVVSLRSAQNNPPFG